MARCTTSGEKFVHFVYSPCVSVHVSKDVDAVCLKDNLTFTELLKPFSQLSKDVILRDSNNLSHTISNLRLKFLDVSITPPTAAVARANLREIVSACASNQPPHNKKFFNGSSNISVPVTTPWFEAWRYVFIQSLWPNTHEFLDHSLACIFVVSTSHPDPVGELVRLSDEQTQKQHADDTNYPRWFALNIAKFYVLVHDASQSDHNRAEETFKRVVNHFGSASCYFLLLFSADQSLFPNQGGLCVEQNGHLSKSQNLSNEDEIAPDPWLSYLLPDGYRLSPTNEVSGQSNTVPSTPVSDPLSGYVADSYHANFGDRSVHISTTTATDAMVQCSLIHSRHHKPHGRRLTQADRDRIRAFVHEFVTRALLPWVEQTMRSLSDQIAHRMRLSRSFLSATKKFFSNAVGGGSGSSSVQTNAINPSGSSSITLSAHSSVSGLLNSISTPSLIGMSGSGGNLPPGSSETVMARNTIAQFGSKEDVQLSATMTTTTTSPVVVYTAEAPEMQMRRLADLAFLFQQYEVAYQTYNVLKRDFQNDNAWLHYAAAQEMSALSIYLQGANSQRQYPQHYIDSSVTIYLQTCQAAELALRATLLNVEALCSRGLYAEAAMSLLRLTSQDDDLTSGLLIEQTAHCVLNMRRPMLRKFAFRMALAAHRYNRARQSHLAIRSYNVAAPILIGRRWSLIEDHINFNVGMQAYLIGDLATSVTALARNLTHFSRQSADRQSLFVREYLVVLKQFLTTCIADGNKQSSVLTSYAIFPLPLIRFHDLKAMLGKPVKQGEDLLLEARGIQFADSEELTSEHEVIDRFLLSLGSTSAWPDTGPEWMESTDVSDIDEDDESEPSQMTAVTQQRFSSTAAFPPNGVSIPGLLERLLTQAVVQRVGDKQSSTTAGLLRPYQMLHTQNTSASRKRPQTLVAPVGEYLTVQIPLENPMRIPLVLTNLHLLWSFQPILSDATAKPVTNETPLDQAQGTTHRHIIANENIPELIMLPGESKAIEISLLPKQMGKLDITGLCFDWIYPSPQHLGQSPQSRGVIFTAGSNVDDPQTQQFNGSLTFALNGTHSEDSYSKMTPVQPPPPAGVGYRAEVNSVRGKISLISGESNFAGDRNQTESLFSRPSSASSLPSFLSWTITRPTALLRVTFSEFPVKLMQGQVYRLNLSLTNTGSEPLDAVHLASNWFGFVGFRSEPMLSQPSNDATAPLETASTEIVINPIIRANQPIQPWLMVPFTTTDESTVRTIAPGSSVLVPMWLRAPHLSCSFRRLSCSSARRSDTGHILPAMSELRTVHMVFQYKSTTPNPDYPTFNTRFVRHRSDLELQPSLRFEAVASRTSLSGPRDILINLVIQNVTSNMVRTSFEILQISCASRRWVLQPISKLPITESGSGTVLASGEVLTLNLRALLANDEAVNPDGSDENSCTKSTPSNHKIFSTVPLVSVANYASQPSSILPVSSPCIDFYYRSGAVRRQLTRQFQSDVDLSSRKQKVSSRLDITLLVFWRTHSPRTVQNSAILYGQSHVPLKRLGHPVTVPVGSRTYARCALRKLHPDADPQTMLSLSARGALTKLGPSAPFNMSELVRLRLNHPSQLYHPFAAETVHLISVRWPLSARSPLALDVSNRQVQSLKPQTSSQLGNMTTERKFSSLIKIPVQIELFNTAPVPVLTKLEAGLDENSFNQPTSPSVTDFTSLQDTSKYPAITRVLWTGLTRKHFLLQPGEVRQLTLYARTARSGLFDVNSLVLKAALASNEPASVRTFVRQSIPTSFVLIDAHKAS